MSPGARTAKSSSPNPEPRRFAKHARVAAKWSLIAQKQFLRSLASSPKESSLLACVSPAATLGLSKIVCTNRRWKPVAEMRADTLEAFDRALGNVRLISGIASTETSLLPSTHKV